MASIRFANCMELPLWAYGITACRVSPSSSVLIPYNELALIPYSLMRDSIHAFGVIWYKEITMAKRNLLLEYSEELAIKIVKLCTEYKIDSNTVFQIKKSSSSVFANITEAQYPQSLADMHSKLEIARKECAETESWLKLIFEIKGYYELIIVKNDTFY